MLAQLQVVTLDFVYIAIVALVTGFAEMSCWMMTGVSSLPTAALPAQVAERFKGTKLIC